MGPTRITAVDESTAFDVSADWIAAALSTSSARNVIANMARRVAAAQSLSEPAAFAQDPPCPPELDALLGTLPGNCFTVDMLGQLWERLLAPDDRRIQGAHFTPRTVADRLVQLTLNARAGYPETIWDPSSGAGAFLLAAARALEDRYGTERSQIVGTLHASDIDRTALDVCDASLEIWSGGGIRPSVYCGDALVGLPAAWPGPVDMIVGNPPFLGQLTTDTARETERRTALREEYPNVTTAYVDDAGLFLELAVRRVGDRGAIGLILPESILGARDAEMVRKSAQASLQLCTLWVDEGQSFEAAVDVVGVVLARREPSKTNHESRVVRGITSAAAVPVPEPASSSWAPLLADALGVPRFSVTASRTVDDLAVITAGFRQHFYGIADAVAEGEASTATPQLMTSGTIDPLKSRWSKHPVRFAGTRWTSPVLHLESIQDGAVQSWFHARSVPKILLASQTRVVEAVVDADGLLVPSVPVVSVEPTDPASLWHLAAVLSSPVATAWILREAAGTGMSHDSVRISARTLARLPLPEESNAWDAGAHHAREAQRASAIDDAVGYVESLRSLRDSMTVAYGVAESVGTWWWERIGSASAFNLATHRAHENDRRSHDAT